MDIKISVIVPVYNMERYLERCLDSLLGQTYKNLQIILINDGSTDRSGAICDEYSVKDERIQVIHKANGGVSSARNVGIQTADGDYMHFVDCDDWIEPNTYERLLQAINENNAPDILFFEYSRDDADGTVDAHYAGEKYLGFMSSDDAFLFSLTAIGSFTATKLYSKKSIAGLTFREDIHWGEDSLYLAQAIEQSETFYYIKDVLYHYVQSVGSATRSSYNPKFLTGLKMSEIFIEMCKKNHPTLVDYAYNLGFGIALELYYQNYYYGHNAENKKMLKKEVKKYAKKIVFSKKIAKRQRRKALIALISLSSYCRKHKKAV